MAFTVSDLQQLYRLLGEQPQLRTQFRMLLLADDLQTLPGRFDRLTEIVEQLAQAQQRTEERLERLEATVQALAQAQQRTEERLEQLAQAQQRTEERLEQLVQAQQRTEERLEQLVEQVQALVSWQRGEAGRRAGERYERLILKRAPLLFSGGQGGATDQPFVQQRLMDKLRPLPAMDLLADDENPFLADLIWWKGDHFVVVEASLQVNGHDVARAAQRAETLQKANVQAIGMVIGEGWVGPDTRHWAEARAVQWKVGDDLSEGLLAFRRLPDGNP